MVALLRLVAPVLFNTVRWPPFGRAHPGGRAHLWFGRAPSQVLKLAENCHELPPLPLARNFDFHVHNKSD